MTARVALFVVALAASFGTQVADAKASDTIRNIPPARHGAPEGTSLETISRAIRQAASERQWHGSSEAPGKMIVSTSIRTHRATVEIQFDDVNFWIIYRDSSNLDYTTEDLIRHERRFIIVVKKGPRIHRNYNVWVQQLAEHISARTNSLIANEVDRENRPSPLLIADEIEKLDELRVRAVLTQEEFDSQKAKLLAQ